MSMRVRINQAIVSALAAGISVLGMVRPGASQSFNQEEIANPNSVVAVASPIGNGSSHQLLLIEQLSDQRPCWSESGSAPTIVNPLLLTFDFTGICSRFLDSNGYSLRMAGQDLGLNYRLSVIRSGNDMLLVGRNPLNRRDPVVEIGRTNGITTDFAKITLNPGWRFTRRSYQGQTLGHIYLTNDRSLAEVAGSAPVQIPSPQPTQPTTPTQPTLPTQPTAPTTGFGDISADIYRNEIQVAVSRGFVSGFMEDNTFRPLDPLTREQLVSLVLEALQRLPGGAFPIPPQAIGNPYVDVSATRWSAAKIQYARDIQLIQGYPDGTFKPAQAVSRAELIAVLRNASIYGQLLQRQGNTLIPRQAPLNFADINGHWAQSGIVEMSSFCQVATPFNEQGELFFPNAAAQRNYAAAATLRMLNCLESPTN